MFRVLNLWIIGNTPNLINIYSFVNYFFPSLPPSPFLPPLLFLLFSLSWIYLQYLTNHWIFSEIFLIPMYLLKFMNIQLLISKIFFVFTTPCRGSVLSWELENLNIRNIFSLKFFLVKILTDHPYDLFTYFHSFLCSFQLIINFPQELFLHRKLYLRLLLSLPLHVCQESGWLCVFCFAFVCALCFNFPTRF